MEINPLSLINRLTPLDADVRASGGMTPVQATITAVRMLNRADLLGEDRELLFSRDSETRKTVVKIVSRATGEVVEQIPPEEVLRMLAEFTKNGRDGSAA